MVVCILFGIFCFRIAIRIVRRGRANAACDERRGERKHKDDPRAAQQEADARKAGHGLRRAGDAERLARPRGGALRNARVNQNAHMIGELHIGEIEGAELGEIVRSSAIAAGVARKLARRGAQPRNIKLRADYQKI